MVGKSSDKVQLTNGINEGLLPKVKSLCNTIDQLQNNQECSQSHKIKKGTRFVLDIQNKYCPFECTELLVKLQNINNVINNANWSSITSVEGQLQNIEEYYRIINTLVNNSKCSGIQLNIINNNPLFYQHQHLLKL